MLRIVKVKNRLSITHAVSAIKCQYKSYLKKYMKSHEKSAMDDNFVPSLAFETADQVVPDQVVEQLSLSGLNLNEGSVENNTDIENSENSTQFDFVEVKINPTEEVNSRNVYYQKYRERKRKVHCLEEIVQGLSSPPLQRALYVISNRYGKKGPILSFKKFYLNFLQTLLKMITL